LNKSCQQLGSAFRLPLISIVASSILFSTGCDGARSTEGGTSGTLKAGEIVLPDFEIKVYLQGTESPLGMGTTSSDGRFQLFAPKATGPLWLQAGEYAFTLEALGPDSPRILRTYSDAKKTPLKLNWDSTSKSLDLRIPDIK